MAAFEAVQRKPVDLLNKIPAVLAQVKNGPILNIGNDVGVNPGLRLVHKAVNAQKLLR